MSEGLGHEQGDTYCFNGLRPHQEFPITPETLDDLDGFIAGVNESLGIDNSGDMYAYSPGDALLPGISMSRHDEPDGLKIIYVSKIVGPVSVNYNVRNDAGTHSDRMRPGACLDVVGRVVLYKTDALTDQDIAELTEELRGRSFEPKRRVTSIYSKLAS